MLYTKDNFNDPYISIGDYTYGPLTIQKLSKNPLTTTIGKFCSIATNVVIAFWGQHQMKDMSTYPFEQLRILYNIDWPISQSTPIDDSSENVYIGNDVWLAHNVLVMQGANIGDGAVVGANCIVASNVRPYAVVVGNPAKEIRRRFSDEDIGKLLEMRWWYWNTEDIKKHLHLITNTCVDDLYNVWINEVKK